MGKRKQYMVTGGAGFIGSHLVERLLDDGHDVLVVDDFSTGRESNLCHLRNQPRLRVESGDIRDCKLLERLMHGVDGVFHLAGYVRAADSVYSPYETFDINIRGTTLVFEAARSQDVQRVVCASSAAVYGESEEPVQSEETVTHPKSPYGMSKLTMEQLGGMYGELYGVDVVALRFFNVYGPRQDPASPYTGVISTFIHRLQQARELNIYGDGLQTRDFVYVGDVVEAALLAMHGGGRRHHVFNVGTGQATTVLQLAGALAELLLGRAPELVHHPPKPGDIRHSCSDLTRVATELGYRPRWSLAEGMEATIHSMAE